jgi:photosystem II stability/assembly factor-like uncharacterized protein
VGYAGIILRTTDGGTTWTEQTSGTGNILYGVSVIDANTATAVGDFGTIVRTTDGGANWTSQTSGVSLLLLNVCFTDVNTGTVVGFGGTVLRTTDGGANWTPQTSGTAFNLWGVSFVDANVGTAVGESGVIIRTDNGGSQWTTQTSGTETAINSVSFTDANTGTAVGGSGLILRTTNGGADWISQSTGSISFRSVSFTDANTGTAVGDVGVMVRTTNAGVTWSNQISGTRNLLRSVYFSDANTGTAVGYAGTILRTTDGGIPVELVSFTASVNGDKVTLRWSTATETNNRGFAVERFDESLNNTWQNIGFVIGNGTTTEPKTYSYTDNNVKPGKYQYRLKQMDFDGSYKYSDEAEVEVNTPFEFTLEQNYPNPFNPATNIGFSLSSDSKVILEVYNVLGQKAASLINSEMTAGNHKIKFDASNLTSGIYFYTLKAKGTDGSNHIVTKKMILLR